MSNPYTTVTVTNYNTSPPADDASAVASNQLFWSKHKDKLGDPLKTAIEGVNTNVLAAFAELDLNQSRAITVNDTQLAADERKLISATGTITYTLLPAVTATAGFTVTVLNAGTGIVTVEGDGSELINNALNRALDPNEVLKIRCNGSGWDIVSEFVTDKMPRGHLVGLTLSNNATDATNDIDIADGEARDTANTADLTVSTAIGKQIDVTWAAGGTPGTPTGGLSSSLTLTNDTTYHVILGLVSATVEVGFDTSVTGANLVTDHSFTNIRRIGSVMRLSAINEVFFQHGDMILSGPYIGISDNAPAATAETQTISDFPTGVRMVAILSAAFSDGTTGTTIWGLASSLDTPERAPSSQAHNYVASLGTATTTVTSSSFEVLTNTSAQIRTRHSSDPGDTTLNISVHGRKDRRGRDG